MSLADTTILNEDITEIANLLNNVSLNEMATLTAAKEIAHTLKPFSGRSEHLEFFINSIDKFHTRYHTGTQDETLKDFVIATIYSKIIDEAGDYLLCHPELTTWPLIKSELRQKFGDKVNRHTLMQQLNFLTKNKNETTLDFLDRLKILKNRIILKINSETLIQSTKTALIEQVEQTTITVLLANVNSELRTILLINNPRDLDDTYNLILNHSIVEQQINTRTQMFRINTNVQHTPTHPRSSFTPKPRTTSNNVQTNYLNHSPNNPFYGLYSTPHQDVSRPIFPNQPINIQPRTNLQQRFPTNREVFGKPANTFSKYNPQRPLDTPKPMSGVSIQPKRSFQRPLPPNNVQRPNQRQPPSNTQHFDQRQNYWRQNPTSNPLVFTEITHLENNYPVQEMTDDYSTNPYGNDFSDYPEISYQNELYHYPQTMYEYSDNPQPSESLINNYDTTEYEPNSEPNENFLDLASQKDNPS